MIGTELGTVKDMLAKAFTRADDAPSRMRGIADFTKAFGKQLDGVMQAMERDLGRLPEAFGMDEEPRRDALKGFVKLSLDLSTAIKTAFGVGKPDGATDPAATPATAGVGVLA